MVDSVNVMLFGGSLLGFWLLLGVGIDWVVKVDDVSGVVIYQVIGGGFVNIGLLGVNWIDLGLVYDVEIKLVLVGDELFKVFIENFQVIGYMYNWVLMYFFIKKFFVEEYNIDSIDDLVKLGVVICVVNNNVGNIVVNIVIFMLEEVGYDEGMIEVNGGVLVCGGLFQQVDLISDGCMDMVINGIFVGYLLFCKVDEGNDVVLLSVFQDIIEKINECFGIGIYIIFVGSYQNQIFDVVMLVFGVMVIIFDVLFEEMGYMLVKSIVLNIDEICGVYNVMKQFLIELLVLQRMLLFYLGVKCVYMELGFFK